MEIVLPDCCVYKDKKIMNAIDDSEMIYIPEGEFIMGLDSFFASKPAHKIYLESYFIDRYPITNEKYQKFIDIGGYQDKKYWSQEGWDICEREEWKGSRYSGYKPWNLPHHPVVGITWYEACAYCCWAQKKLPTEAQWEKAAKGGLWLDGDKQGKIKNVLPERLYPWGNEQPQENGVFRAVFKNETNYGNKSSAPVDFYPEGNSPYGCGSMSGNVWEWCLDWYSTKEYRKERYVSPQGAPSGDQKVLRGGSWCRDEKEIQSSFRTKDFPDTGGWDLSGFRGAIVY